MLELGCGSGAVGVAVARAAAAQVLLTDGDAASVHNCIINCWLNGLNVKTWQVGCHRAWPKDELLMMFKAWSAAAYALVSTVKGACCSQGSTCDMHTARNR